jgi:hypothetical protein
MRRRRCARSAASHELPSGEISPGGVVCHQPGLELRRGELADPLTGLPRYGRMPINCLVEVSDTNDTAFAF